MIKLFCTLLPMQYHDEEIYRDYSYKELLMKRRKQPECDQYQIPDPKEFADRVVKEAIRKSILGLIIEFVILIAAGILLGILMAQFQKCFNISTGVIEGIITVVSILLTIFAGYCWYQYYKTNDDDDIDE